MVRWLVYEVTAYQLTKWEWKFLRSIEPKMELSILQVAKIQEIYDHYRHGKRSYCGGYQGYIGTPKGPYCEELGVSYDEVHDFDR